MAALTKRLTHYATGGGCACKIPPGELEDVLAGAVRDRADAARLASLGMSILVGFQQIHHPPDPSLLRMHLEDYHVLVLRHVPRPDGGHTIVSRA